MEMSTEVFQFFTMILFFTDCKGMKKKDRFCFQKPTKPIPG